MEVLIENAVERAFQQAMARIQAAAHRAPFARHELIIDSHWANQRAIIAELGSRDPGVTGKAAMLWAREHLVAGAKRAAERFSESNPIHIVTVEGPPELPKIVIQLR